MNKIIFSLLQTIITAIFQISGIMKQKIRSWLLKLVYTPEPALLTQEQYILVYMSMTVNL